MSTPGGKARRTGVLGAGVLTVLVVIYLAVVVPRSLEFVQTGRPVGVGFGIVVGVLPLLALWAIGRAWLLATRVQAMADELAAAGALPVDDLPRSARGEVDRAAAAEAFEPLRVAVEADPESWRAWYDVAFAYDAAGDRRRARAALRTAAALRRGAPVRRGR